MAPKQVKALQLGCMVMTRQKLNFSLGQYTTVFHAEVYAIMA
jgi:hypothetical protein